MNHVIFFALLDTALLVFLCLTFSSLGELCPTIRENNLLYAAERAIKHRVLENVLSSRNIFFRFLPFTFLLYLSLVATTSIKL